MRTRLIRPEFWTDSKMADLSPPVRLTYIGLWCLADDAGFLEWEPREIAAQLYRYRNGKQRERDVDRHLAALVDAERIRLLECGVHAVIPSIPDHRIKGGEQLYTVQKRHERRCSVALRRTTSDSVSVSVTSSVSEAVTGSGRARETGSIDPEHGWNELGVSWGRKPRVAQA